MCKVGVDDFAQIARAFAAKGGAVAQGGCHGDKGSVSMGSRDDILSSGAGAMAECDMLTGLTGTNEITTSIPSRNSDDSSPLCIAVRIIFPDREMARYGGLVGEKPQAPIVVQVPQY